LTQQTGYKIKEPFDEVLADILQGKITEVSRIEKGYLVQIQNLYEIKILDFEKLNVKPKVKACRRRKLSRGSLFDFDIFLDPLFKT
jgi:hypothetical protein|tara:strand:+ start:13995 stop:14252 length:258 start_codon:yes stop_codon:yes gene_type:complete